MLYLTIRKPCKQCGAPCKMFQLTMMCVNPRCDAFRQEIRIPIR